MIRDALQALADLLCALALAAVEVAAREARSLLGACVAAVVWDTTITADLPRFLGWSGEALEA